MDNFAYAGERFADIQILRYQIRDFDTLSLRQKCYVYCLSKATLYGRDITFDQFGKHNLRIRRLLEAVYVNFKDRVHSDEFDALEVYLKRVWFSSGIHHHYGCEKFLPSFSETFLRGLIYETDVNVLPLHDGESVEDMIDELFPVIFNPEIFPKRVNKNNGDDLVLTSSCNYYEGVTQQEVEEFYAAKRTDDKRQPSWGLNSTLVKDEGGLKELVWKREGRYGRAIEQIVYWLKRAEEYVENDSQRKVISLLVDYYESGSLDIFDRYSVEWVKLHEGQIDFINGFIEVYGDPLGIKASWEGIVEIKDLVATKRTAIISDNAQWFEDHSPVDSRFRKKVVKGVTANVVQAAMLGGDEYPSTAIGINLPNADWIRADYGSKSVTISNLTEAYDLAAKGNGFREEFVIDNYTKELIDRWGHLCDDLHTDLHECLGHGSGQLLDGVSPDALQAYGSTIEEARADLYGLYYIADPKLLELGLLTSPEAYKANYYTYLMNGLMTQLVRIQPGHQIEEAHMRNRAMIAHWILEHYGQAVELIRQDGKTFARINDYEQLRMGFAELLAEVQRIKSEGDLSAARQIVERYAVAVDENLHEEVLTRYSKLKIAPYKGFLNPRMLLVKDDSGNVVDVKLDYTESYTEQMLRYSHEYAAL